MEHIGKLLKEKNIELDTLDPVARGGFTQVPNFIMEDPRIPIGAKVTYGLFLKYAWHNESCFPGQERLAKEMGMSVASVSAFIKHLQSIGLIEIIRRGQGKTNLYKIKFTVKSQKS